MKNFILTLPAMMLLFLCIHATEDPLCKYPTGDTLKNIKVLEAVEHSLESIQDKKILSTKVFNYFRSFPDNAITAVCLGNLQTTLEEKLTLRKILDDFLTETGKNALLSKIISHASSGGANTVAKCLYDLHEECYITTSQLPMTITLIKNPSVDPYYRGYFFCLLDESVAHKVLACDVYLNTETTKFIRGMCRAVPFTDCHNFLYLAHDIIRRALQQSPQDCAQCFILFNKNMYFRFYLDKLIQDWQNQIVDLIDNPSLTPYNRGYLFGLLSAHGIYNIPEPQLSHAWWGVKEDEINFAHGFIATCDKNQPLTNLSEKLYLALFEVTLSYAKLRNFVVTPYNQWLDQPTFQDLSSIPVDAIYGYIHDAINFKNLEALEFLLTHPKLNINKQFANDREETILHETRDPIFFIYLVKQGANPHAKNIYGKTPLDTIKYWSPCSYASLKLAVEKLETEQL
ncbi:MAG: hypothetical protein H6679_00165 [Epsilonproteobacteria bacterium]|nr:hypothetical protein [Campylobacterota bacterium]